MREVGRGNARRFAGVIVVMAGFAVCAPAALATPTVDIGSSSGPLTHVYIGNDFSCQVNHTGDTSNEFYPPDTVPGDCGTFLAVANTLYGPDFGNHGTTATGDLNGGSGDTLFSNISQSAVSGSGTSSSPRQVVTSGDAGTSGLHISENDSYVDGTEYYRSDVTIRNSTASAITATLFHAGDCYLQNSDEGYGWYDSSSGSILCSENPNNSPSGRILGFQPLTSGSHYTETFYATVWSQITQSGTQFPDSCDCNTQEDNGAGLSWAITVPALGSTTVSFYSTFSPTGALADAPISASGTTINATEGKSFSGTVATAHDPDSSATGSQYSASINWGDGSTSNGTVSGSGGNFIVTGSHTYTEQGSYTVTVKVTDIDNPGNSATATSSAHVADAALHARSVRPHKSGLRAYGTFARFTDDNPGDKTSEYTVTIKWGDGHATTAKVRRANGHFYIKNGHTYKHTGSYKITIKIVDDGGSTATVHRTVTFAAAQRAQHVTKPAPKFTG
jgi:hypothetical protein